MELNKEDKELLVQILSKIQFTVDNLQMAMAVQRIINKLNGIAPPPDALPPGFEPNVEDKNVEDKK